jgi:two-component system, NtrC family, sensor kinase
MDTPGAALAPEQELRRINGRLGAITQALGAITLFFLVLALWGRWRALGVVLVIGSVTGGVNKVLERDFFAVEVRPEHEALRLGANLTAAAVYGHLSGWIFPVWMFLPMSSLWMRHPERPWHRVRMYGLFLGVGVLALLEGCPPLMPVCMLLLSVFIAVVSASGVRVMTLTVEGLSRREAALTQALHELDLTHRRAREQERLSSLGMLAAGIAHEINNPMSYVKSNLHALRLELLGQRELPASLREYAAEVLPETLEGVQRVCSIVADLRRFARGDPEALIPYDLNEEVNTALRITKGRLQAHCDVEVRLEPLQAMLGHPRQISQVVVNLLVNAAQAMPQRGRVFVSTAPDGEDDVVLTVRDTGEGMSPEVLAHLFQPFFTTRREGPGLGLAVAHGIITSHGGRIRVESAPGEGSTFIIRLPRVPPFNFTRQSSDSSTDAAAAPTAADPSRHASS